MNNEQPTIKKRGFTLMEMLVYVGVLAIIVTTVSVFFLWAIRSNSKTRVMRETLNNASRAMEIITYEIREARSIYTPTTTSTQLSLETTHYMPAGEKTTYTDFYLCENQLCFKKESQDPIALTSDRVEVKNLLFTQITTTSTYSSIQINLVVEYKNPAVLPQYQASVDLTSTVSLRNY